MRRSLGILISVGLAVASILMLPGGARAFDFELPSDDDRWIRVETPNFTVFSNTEVRIARRIAERFDQLWEVLRRDLEGLPPSPSVPTSIFVFDLAGDAFVPYGPTTKKGRPIESGGFVATRQLDDMIAIVDGDYRYRDHLGVVHDYVDSVLDAYHPQLPLWLEEGVSEYYSVFHIEEGKAHVGYRVNRHIAWLRNKPLIPLPELLAIDESSRRYDDQTQTGMFYAESWLLTHMLLSERPNGRAQAMEYAQLLRRGVDRDTAFQEAFQVTYQELEKELKKYIRNRSYHYTVYPLSQSATGGSRTSVMTRAEVLVRLGQLLGIADDDHRRFAAEHFNAALAIDPGSAAAVVGLGQLHEAVGKDEAALALYEQATELDPESPRAHLLLGRALYDGLDRTESATIRSKQLERARKHLLRSARLRPGLVEPWVVLGSTYIGETGDATAGIAALERAMELQPKRPDIGINLVTLAVDQGSTVLADSVIDRMARAGVEPAALDRAREIAARLHHEPTIE